MGKNKILIKREATPSFFMRLAVKNLFKKEGHICLLPGINKGNKTN